MTSSESDIRYRNEGFRPDPKKRFMDQVREVLHYHHYNLETARSYCGWIVRFIHFHGKLLPRGWEYKKMIDPNQAAKL